MAKIKTFEEACEKLGINPAEFVITLPEKASHHAKAIAAHAKLVIITEALNDGWKPDWSNGKWDKYYPWFYMNTSSGSGFSYGVYVYDRSGSRVGSRLCFKSSDLAKYAAGQFTELYRDYFLID